MMSAEKPPRRIEPRFDADEDSEAGARLGAPPPDWDEEDESTAGLSGGSGVKRTWMIRGGIVAMVCLVVLPLLWFAYQLGADDRTATEIPLVSAVPGPVKTKPDDPGGETVPYQDQLILNGEAGNGAPRVESLLPPPEEPLPVPQPAEAPDLADGMTPDPAEVPTVEVPEAAVPQTIPGEAAPAASDDPIGTLVAEVGKAAGQAVAAATDDPPKPAQNVETQVAEVVGTFVLQVASLKSNQAAEGEWARLQSAYPDLLTGLSLFVQEAEIENVGKVYRMQIGTFPTRSTAADLCAELKTRKLDCFVLQR